MQQHKKLTFSLVTFVLCLVVLVGAFLIAPNVTRASSPKTPLAVTSVGSCTQIVPIGNAQTCVMVVSMPQNVSKGIHFSVSESGVWCYASCNKASLSGVIFTSEPEGNTLHSTSDQIPIVIIAPLSIHGTLTVTFVVTGPSNSVKEQFVVTNTEG